MSSGRWAAISFGCTLALVVGLRLSAAGLLLVGTLLLSALLLCPLFALRLVGPAGAGLPEVRIERPPSGGLGRGGGEPARLLEAHQRPTRRGGWSHLGRGAPPWEGGQPRAGREEPAMVLGERS